MQDYDDGYMKWDVDFVAGDTKYDFDDGIAKWEIDFVVGSNKYEYEINATNGAIFKSQIESIYYD